MNQKINSKQVFVDLVTAYDGGDDAIKESLIKKIRNSKKTFRAEVDADIQWDESQIEGFSEAPTVIQTYKIYLGNEIVYEGERWFGKEFVDPTHTGLGGRWEVIRVDERGDDSALEILEEFEIIIDEPNVPDWK